MEGRRVPQSDKTAMQRSIMEATIHIVAQYGLDKTTTRLIAAEAGLNEAYLYRCFKNKEDILSESFRAVDFAFVAHLHKILPVMQLAGTTWEDAAFCCGEPVGSLSLKTRRIAASIFAITIPQIAKAMRMPRI